MLRDTSSFLNLLFKKNICPLWIIWSIYCFYNFIILKIVIKFLGKFSKINKILIITFRPFLSILFVATLSAPAPKPFFSSGYSENEKIISTESPPSESSKPSLEDFVEDFYDSSPHVMEDTTRWLIKFFFYFDYFQSK